MTNALGDVGVQGIPALTDPTMIAAMAQQGAYMIGHLLPSQGNGLADTVHISSASSKVRLA